MKTQHEKHLEDLNKFIKLAIKIETQFLREQGTLKDLQHFTKWQSKIEKVRGAAHIAMYERAKHCGVKGFENY